MLLHLVFKNCVPKSLAKHHKERYHLNLTVDVSHCLQHYIQVKGVSSIQHSNTLILLFHWLSSDLSNLASCPSRFRFITHFWSCLESSCKHNFCISYMIWDQLSLSEAIVWSLGYLCNWLCKNCSSNLLMCLKPQMQQEKCFLAGKCFPGLRIEQKKEDHPCNFYIEAMKGLESPKPISIFFTC